GVYTGSYIQTSITDKCLNSGILIEQDCNRTVYGSWAEYEAIARGPITNFASASGYGFSSTPDPHGGGGRAGGISKSTYNDPYNYSHATISNNGSAGAISANLGLSNIGVDDAFLARIISRYGSTTGGYDSCNIGPIDEWQVRNAPGRVLTFRCPGTANINGNIITGHDYYSKIDEIPQVIIIANDININSNVTEVDAWLIATNNTNIATGSINTCPQFSRGTTSSASGRDYRIHDDACTNQLTINGPVIAGRVYLNRTSGAYPGDNSIEPAEVFNLRADAYLWGYSQSEDFHQAVTTYTREVAPRY
ncbi:hypothetical protein IKG54_01110, partial [Candidatus Saccharibacteria bacterium]|nr:hypothetical protein [Candidatus Saccharibacteria bacterium]